MRNCKCSKNVIQEVSEFIEDWYWIFRKPYLPLNNIYPFLCFYELFKGIQYCMAMQTSIRAPPCGQILQFTYMLLKWKGCLFKKKRCFWSVFSFLFQLIRQKSASLKEDYGLTTAVGEIKENAKKNRYRDILPCT